MEQLFQMESVSARIRKKGDLWSGGNFISNQSHDKIITERRGEVGGGALIEEGDLRDCRIHDVRLFSLDLKLWMSLLVS